MSLRLQRDVACILFLLLASSCMWITRLHGGIDLRWDGGVYYILGTSLAEGKGYRLLNEPGEIRAIQYPPALPVLVAVHQRILGTNDIILVGHALKLTYFGIYSALVIGSYAMARRLLGPPDSLLVAAISGLTVHIYFLSDLLFADLPFTLLTLLFVLSNTANGTLLRTLGTGTLGAAAYLLRTSGLALLTAWVLEAFVQRDWRRAALRATIAILPVLAWQSYINSVRSDAAYKQQSYAYQRAPYQFYNVGYDENIALVDPFKPEFGRAGAVDICSRVAANIVRLPFALGRALLSAKSLEARNFGLDMVLDLAIGGVLVASLVVSITRRIWLESLYIISALGLICLTPWPKQLGRYMAPLAPFLALAMVQFFRLAAEAATLRVPALNRIGSSAVYCLAIVFASRQGLSDFNINADRASDTTVLGLRGNAESGHFFYGHPWASLEASARWLATHAKPGEVIATVAPHQFYLAGVPKAVMFPMEPDPDKAQALLDSVPASYLVIDANLIEGITQRYATPVVRKHPELWELISGPSDRLTKVYRRRNETKN